MASIFGNNPKFQNLSPQAKELVLQKFASLSPEAQEVVKQKIASQAEDPQVTKQRALVNELKSMGIGSSTVKAQENKLKLLEEGKSNKELPFSLQEQPFDTTGENLAEKLAEKGIDPNIAAGLGTAFSMIPEFATSLPLFKGAKPGAKGAKIAGKAIKESGLGKAIRFTGDKDIATLSEKISELPIKQRNLAGFSKQALEKSKQGIQKAEEALQIGLKDLPETSSVVRDVVANKKKLSKFITNTLRVVDKGEDFLAKNLDKKALQLLRKVSQEALKKGGNTLDDLSKSNLFKIKKVTTNALTNKLPKLQKALGKFQEAKNILDALPNEFKTQKEFLKLALTKAQNLAKKQSNIRKIAGTGIITAALGGFGAKLGRRAAE